MAYIYCITNKINNKKYIGKTALDIHERFKLHCYDSKKRRCEKRPLYSAMRKYGIENFEIETICECCEEELAEKEIFYIKEYNTYGRSGYNATKGGDGKFLFDRTEITNLYQLGLTMKQVSQKCGCCFDTVRDTLREHHIKIRKNAKVKLNQYSKDHEFILLFESVGDACRWIIKTKNLKSPVHSVLTGISRQLRGFRNFAFGYIWEKA